MNMYIKLSIIMKLSYWIKGAIWKYNFEYSNRFIYSLDCKNSILICEIMI